MNRPRKRMLGAAAISVLAAASLAGIPSSASADEVCINCVAPPSALHPGLANAALKLAGKDFPGKTDQVFYKFATDPSDYIKIDPH